MTSVIVLPNYGINIDASSCRRKLKTKSGSKLLLLKIVCDKGKDHHQAKERRDTKMVSGMNDQVSRVDMMSATEVIAVITGLKIIIMRVATENMIGIDSGSTGHAMNVVIATDAE